MNITMLLWFPKHVSKEKIFECISHLDRSTFAQIVQDRIHSRYPSFSHYKIYVDDNFEEIDTTCAICLENGDYQLNCGHIYHKHCIMRWKKKCNTCPLCRKPI